MGIRRIKFFSLLIVIALLSGCQNTFHTAHIDLSGVKLTDVVAHSTAAYYLSHDGILYSPGADSDAGSFVSYTDSEKGIVAQDVAYFTEILGGGAYIDHHNNLHIWSKTTLPLLEYSSAPNHQQILEDVRWVASSSYGIIYITSSSDLYLIGEYHNEKYDIRSPKLLGGNVIAADIDNNRIIWADHTGTLYSYSDMDDSFVAQYNTHFAGADITQIHTTPNYIALLSNNELWYYGDYQQLISGEPQPEKQLVFLQENVKSVSCALRTIGAVDPEGNLCIWGRCISNGSTQTQQPEVAYYEKKVLAENADSIFVSDSTICYIDENGHSQIFHSDGWQGFYGNSTNDSCVGINARPCTWVKD